VLFYHLESVATFENTDEIMRFSLIKPVTLLTLLLLLSGLHFYLYAALVVGSHCLLETAAWQGLVYLCTYPVQQSQKVSKHLLIILSPIQ